MKYALLCAVLLSLRCDSATEPSPVSQILFTQHTPASGSTIAVPGSPPQFLLPEWQLLNVSMALTSAREYPYAQLNLYLLTDDTGANYCGQNLPDTPIWQPLPPGTLTRTVRGFQIFRLPCDVVGIRAMLHNRIGGLLTPPTPGFTIAEAILPVRYQLRAASQ